jgi:hypothetical protein
MNYILTIREYIPATEDTREGVLVTNIDATAYGNIARCVQRLSFGRHDGTDQGDSFTRQICEPQLRTKLQGHHGARKGSVTLSTLSGLMLNE